MRDMLVLSVLGDDRTGLVETIAKHIAAVGGNWEESKMARLAGQFAGIVLVAVEPARTDELVATLRGLDGLQVIARPTRAMPEPSPSQTINLVLTGQDRAGIVRDVARILADAQVNVEELESECAPAPMSSERMFTAKAVLHIPAGLTLHDLRSRLESLAGELMVDLTPA